MEKYFKPVKRLRTAEKSSSGGGERPAKTASTSRSPVKRDEESFQKDAMLWVKDSEEGRRVTFWRPESPYSLGSGEEEYVPAEHLVLAAPEGVVRNAEGGWSLRPFPLKEHRRTSLRFNPGCHLEGVLFSSPHHPHQGQGTLQLDFPATMDYLTSFYETGFHVLEVLQEEAHATTRFIVGPWMDPSMPHLPFYAPKTCGGPWFLDSNRKHMFLQTVRSFRSAHRLPHHLEFFLCVNSKQQSRLEELCSETQGGPQETSD